MIPWLTEPGTTGSVVVHTATTNPDTGAAGLRILRTTLPIGEGPAGWTTLEPGSVPGVEAAAKSRRLTCCVPHWRASRSASPRGF
jgi:hypothetical protein